MKKRIRLRKWVKVVLSMILGAIGVLVYNNALKLGALGQDNTFYLGICFIEWTYLFIVQFLLLDLIWND